MSETQNTATCCEKPDSCTGCCDTGKTCCSNNGTNKCCDKLPYIIIIILLAIISVMSFIIGKNYDTLFAKNTNNTSNSISSTSNKNLTIQIVDDKRCTDCQTKALVDQLKTLPFLTGATFEQMDFSDKKAKDLLTKNNISAIPAILVNTNKISDTQFTQYLKETPAGLYSLEIGAQFNPYAEICDNNIDDNEDGVIDCDDKSCDTNIKCAKKVERPVADLYIMSYCPYGLQAQKGYLEVMSKLSKVADVNIKFVQYVMHGQKEADENVVQYCIQKNEKDKYIKYLNCFLAKEGQGEACQKEAKLDSKKLATCITETKKTYGVDEKMADTTKQFPDFDIDRESALKAGVQGSPTFVLNGIKMDKIGRDAKSFADAICSTFIKKPKECEQTFQNVNFDPMFGFTSNGSNASSACGK